MGGRARRPAEAPARAGNRGARSTRARAPRRPIDPARGSLRCHTDREELQAMRMDTGPLFSRARTTSPSCCWRSSATRGNIHAGEDKVVDSLVMVAQQYLDDRNLDGLDLIVDRLDFLGSRGPASRRLHRRVLEPGGDARASGRPDRRPAVRSPRGACAQTEASSQDGCAPLPIPALLEILATSEDRGVRKLVLDLLASLAGSRRSTCGR